MVHFTTVITYLSVMAALAVAVPASVTTAGLDPVATHGSGKDYPFCAWAWFHDSSAYLAIEPNECVNVHANPDRKISLATNVNCLTCWFYTGENCDGDITWYGLTAPQEDIYFQPSRSAICRR